MRWKIGQIAVKQVVPWELKFMQSKTTKGEKYGVLGIFRGMRNPERWTCTKLFTPENVFSIKDNKVQVLDGTDCKLSSANMC